MRKRATFKPAVFVIAMTLSATAAAAAAPNQASANAIDFKWSAKTGLGYDSNAYQAPSSAYFDLATGKQETPKVKSGFFVPYEAKVEVEKARNQDSTLIGSASIDGSLYLGSGLGNANESNLDLMAGVENVLKRKGKSKDMLYIGGVLERHNQTYVDHDSGLGKTTTLSGRDVSSLYNYTRIGIEAEYKNRTGAINFGLTGKLLSNDYEAQRGMPQQDHTYFRAGGDVDIPLVAQTGLNLSYNHVIRDYAYRHAHAADATFTTKLLQYSYDTIGAELRSRLSAEWVLYADLDHTQRTDNNVGYGDYDQNRYGIRVLYSKDRIKSRLSLHQWARDYPNGFAFDVLGGGAKKYDGIDLRLKGELEQSKNSALWVELKHEIQNSTDLRYDFSHMLLMAGMSWAY